MAKDPVLRPLFPGKSLRCATEEFAAFLIQFLGGDEEQTQPRWWLSLRESHARFRIAPAQRQAWLRHMNATLDATPMDAHTRQELRRFFGHGASYVADPAAAALLPSSPVMDEELAARWAVQRTLDDAISSIAAGDDEQALTLVPAFAARPVVFLGLLARMVQSGRAALIAFAIEAVERNPSLAARRFSGRPLLHLAAGAGCVEVVSLLLRLKTDPNLVDRGGHTPLYSVANECASPVAGPALVRLLAGAGGDVNACGGVTAATPLHMAARRGHAEVARTLIELGAAINVKDKKGDTPLRRALNCRKEPVAQLLAGFGAIA